MQHENLHTWQQTRAIGPAVDLLLADLGLADHPHIQPRWALLRERPAIQDAKGPAPLPVVDAHAMQQLGVAVLQLRPMRAADVHEVWWLGSVDLRHRAVDHLDVRVSGTVDHLHASVGSTGVALLPDAPPHPELFAAVRDRASTLGSADSLVLRVHLADLSPEALEQADSVDWEVLLDACRTAPVHVERIVGGRPAVPPRPAIDSVGFFTIEDPESPQLPPFARDERAELAALWRGRLLPSTTLTEDVLHVHAHGTQGAIPGLDSQAIRARMVLFNACTSAEHGGIARQLVRDGHVAHTFGFDTTVTVGTTRLLTRAFHTELLRWVEQPDLGAEFAALAVRTALGDRHIGTRWRHYRSAVARAPLAPSSTAL